jgi:cyclic pyranopterin phosphate synthase
MNRPQGAGIIKSELQVIPALAERINTNDISVDARELIQIENQVPVRVGVDTSIRPKILDACGMSCTFCHNEGTPVALAQISLGIPNLRYKGGRVSAFEETNGVDFLPGTMLPGRDFEFAIGSMRAAIGASEMHITGGEPTLHSQLPEIIHTAREAGYVVGMTSNGENGEKTLEACAEAGLSKVNFSIFGTTAEELAAVQHPRFRSKQLADAKLRALDRSIRVALESGLKVSANIVMSDTSHEERIRRVIDKYAGAGVTVRILDDLDRGDVSDMAIYELLAKLDAKPQELLVEAGSSNSRVSYELSNGSTVYFKQIRRTVLPKVCDDCTLNNDVDCKEGYYGVRLYVDRGGTYRVGVCLQRMDLVQTVEDFSAGDLSNIVTELRNREFDMLTDYYKDRIHDGNKK